LIFLVARLLADEHQARFARTLAADALRRAFPQIATATRVDVAFLRQRIGRRLGHRDSR
jgi:hypothetical protein